LIQGGHPMGSGNLAIGHSVAPTSNRSKAVTQSEDHIARSETPFAGRPVLNWKWMLFAGIVYLIGAFVAFLNPFIASLLAQSLIAAAFLIGGIAAIWMAFRNEDGTTGGRIIGAVTGLLAVIFAIALWTNPLAGLVSLTITVAALFFALGVMRIWLGFRMRERKGWGWIVASGAVTLALAVLIFVALPATSLSILGLLLGVELAFAGAAHIATALTARSDEAR